MTIEIKSILDSQIKLLQEEGNEDGSKKFLTIYKTYFTGADRELLLAAANTNREEDAEKELKNAARISYNNFYSNKEVNKVVQFLKKQESHLIDVAKSRQFLADVSVMKDYKKIRLYLVPISSSGGCSAKYKGQYHVFINPSRLSAPKLTPKERHLLLVHEFIHAHHIRASGIDVSDAGWGYKLHYALFMEGLATFFTGKFCDASFKEGVSSEEAVGREPLKPKDKEKIANEILNQLDKKITSDKYKETMENYFFGPIEPTQKDLCKGYTLGYELIEELFKTYTFEKLCKFKEKKIKEECKEWLERVSIKPY